MLIVLVTAHNHVPRDHVWQDCTLSVALLLSPSEGNRGADPGAIWSRASSQKRSSRAFSGRPRGHGRTSPQLRWPYRTREADSLDPHRRETRKSTGNNNLLTLPSGRAGRRVTTRATASLKSLVWTSPGEGVPMRPWWGVYVSLRVLGGGGIGRCVWVVAVGVGGDSLHLS